MNTIESLVAEGRLPEVAALVAARGHLETARAALTALYSPRTPESDWSTLHETEEYQRLDAERGRAWDVVNAAEHALIMAEIRRPTRSAAYRAIRDVALNAGIIRHYWCDLVTDREIQESLRTFSRWSPPARFVWIMRESGTHTLFPGQPDTNDDEHGASLATLESLYGASHLHCHWWNGAHLCPVNISKARALLQSYTRQIRAEYKKDPAAAEAARDDMAAIEPHAHTPRRFPAAII